MSKFFSGKEVVNKLVKAGFNIVGQKGSHVKLKGVYNGKSRIVIVPMHREIAFGTFRSILNQSGMTLDEFNKV
jgi:predicted RNA binding protein YcfA (HicA-like mRNA interferase family)